MTRTMDELVGSELREYLVTLSAARAGYRRVRLNLPTSTAMTVTRYICPKSASVTASILPRLVLAARSPKPTVAKVEKLK